MSEQKNVELTVEGMTCTNCAQTVRRSLEKQGMQNVQVDFATGSVMFENTAGLPVGQVIGNIDELGYKVVGHKDEKKNS